MVVDERKKVGVVLFQLGGPDSPEAVEPFLYNLFCDPDIIPLGPLGGILRKPLARYIARRRSRVAAHHYNEIGGQSPIRLLTERQARALESALRPHVEPRVVVAMRYWHPLTAEAVQQIDGTALNDLVLLPLYPQYSFATSRSSLNEWARVYRQPRPQMSLHTIENFYSHPLYIQAIAERIALSLAHFDRPNNAHLVFSAHGLPMSLVERGDPYPRQVEATVRLVLECGGWPNAHTLCFQSKVGRQKWLEPSLTETIERLAHAGAKHVLVVPIAFVTEHIETLHEINIEAREQAERLGVEQFEMMPALGDSPRFIATLADLVLRAVGMEVPLVASTK
ncbi:MAG TPA: ferrochelatase [Candidatus Acidoferrales bacterium]|jgi:ferrochelatase|nr:ferrochelatase [Candidatus Acidoferrales bacterium]